MDFIKYAAIAQSVEQGTENPRVGGSIPPLGMVNILCASGSVVERRLAKAKVAGSIPVSRFLYFLRECWNWQTGKTKDLV